MNSSNRKKLGIFALAFVLLFVVIISGLHILESTVFNNETALEPEQEVTDSKTVEKDNIKYFPRQDIITLLLIGVDQMGKAEDSGFHVNEGSADVVALLVFDEKNEEINILSFNRDSMVEIPLLGMTGERAGTFVGQLALSHTYGSGLEDSCENTLETISNLLGGLEIDYYAALNMGGIPAVNDAVGGVTVNVTDDFSAVDPDITIGEFTLKGEQALTFIRSRKNLGDQLNISRGERHKEYVKGFVESYHSRTESESVFATKILDATEGYLVTNCSANVLMGFAERYGDYEIGEIVSLKGENILGEEFYEFYIDEGNLEEIKLKFFYAPK
ncbi:MAG: LCP family protein [Oscillospiraceae bacterium]|nr:LCP family protein [Oscillospiraceae bacterium]